MSFVPCRSIWNIPRHQCCRTCLKRGYNSLTGSIITFSITLKKIRVWLETQKPAWTGLRRTNGENRVIMKKWNLIGKNKHFRHFLMKTWNEEDPYGILFHIAVCPEEPCGIDFFKKSSENWNPKNPKNIKNPLFRLQNQYSWIFWP